MEENNTLKSISFVTAIHGVEMYGLVLMTLEGRIVTWNAGAQKLLGFSEAEVVGRQFAFLFTPEDQAAQVPQREMAKAASIGYAYDDRWHVCKNGARVYVNGGLCLLKADDDQPIGFVKIVRDQTEKKQHVEEIERLHAELLESHKQLEDYASDLETKVRQRTQMLNERNAELQDFCYSVAHDLRAPLRSIQAMSQVVIEDYGDVLDEKGKQQLGRIVKAGGQLDQLTIDLLEYTRFSREEITLGPISFQHVVDEVLTNLGETISAIGATLAVREPLDSAFGQHAYTVQIVGNFISNSLKFVKLGQRPAIEIWTAVTDKRVRLYVKDNGIGIPPEYQDKIFVLFERLNVQGEYEGTGAGLTIARKAAHRMKGEIGITSQPGQGSTFWLELGIAE
jgi:PAS domain S-box-containing protein